MAFGNPPAIGFTNAPIVFANQVILIGPNESLLAYSPSEGFGNLVASISSSQFLDQFGNQVLNGVWEYFNSAGTYIASGSSATANGFLIMTAPGAGGPYTTQGFWGYSSPGNTNIGNSAGGLIVEGLLTAFNNATVNGLLQVGNGVSITAGGLIVVGTAPGALKVSGSGIIAAGAVGASTAPGSALEAQGTLAHSPFPSSVGSATNTVAETVIGTINIPAGDAQSFTTAYEWRIAGNINAAAAMNVTLRMRIGGLTGPVLATFGPFTVRALIVGMAFGLSGRAMCRSNGTGGHFDSWSELSEQIVAATSAWHGDQTQFVAQDTVTAAYTIVLTAQMSVANAGNQAQTQEVNCVRFSH